MLKMFIARGLLLFVYLTLGGIETLRGNPNDRGANIISEFRQKAQIINATTRSRSKLLPEKLKRYLSPEFNLVCNSTVGSGAAVEDVFGIFGTKHLYKNVCITDGSCVKQIYPDLSVALWCRGEDEELECRSTINPAKGLACCRGYSFCNGALNIAIKASSSATSGWCRILNYVGIGILLLTVLLGLIFAIVLIKRPKDRLSFWIFKQLRRHRILRVAESESLLDEYNAPESGLIQKIVATYAEETGADSRKLQELSSGSGSGLPDLIQRTVARQMELLRIVGKGRFGQVWVATWRGETVAVKIFNTFDEKSWEREVEIYESTWFRHSHLLTYLASDNRDSGSELQLWLVTEYHQYGSLFDYLQANCLNAKTAAKMLRSIASGLSYLHHEVENSTQTRVKPGIAHRDIKSNNVLVRTDLTCVLADFGVSAKSYSGKLNMADNKKCGTARYLAPEVLASDVPLATFEQYKMADMYAFGLVMWEVLRRCNINGFAPNSELPYYAWVARDPTSEEMKKVVVDNEMRPLPCDHWNACFFAREVYRVMTECWATKPSARLTAANTRIYFDRLIAYFGWHNPKAPEE